MRIKLYWFGIIVLCIVLGFFLEFVKVNINFTLDEGAQIQGFWEMDFQGREMALYNASRHNPFDYYHSHTRIGFLNHLSQTQLKLLKWIVTIVFVVVFYLVNASMIRKLIHDDRGVKWLRITYMVSFAFAFFIYLIGLPTSNADLFYNVSRKMVGALQSPIPAMMNWAAWRLYEQNKIERNGIV